MLVRRTLKVSLAGQARVNKARITLGYTFEEIATRAHISTSTVRRFFSGKSVTVNYFFSICQILQLKPEEIIDKPKKEEEGENNDVLRVERSIEFPPEYWEAGTSILSYFSRVLRVKYPSQKIKVRIEQEGLRLRLIIDTPTGGKEKIEKTLEEYGLVVTGKIRPENFLSDPFEAMALRNKLEIADLELRQARNLLDFTRDNSQQRIESLEVQVNKLHSIIENGLQSGNHVFGVMKKMAEQDKSRYDLRDAKFGGGFAAEGGFQVGGNLIDLSSANNLTDADQQIQEVLQQFEVQGVSIEDAKQQAASTLAKQAEANPTVMGKLVKWGQSLADTAGKTTVSEAVKGVIKLALQMSGIPLP
jgi:transcriptional regulator with XRE-family HTH domain